jgi:hypothetical protein
MLTIMAVFGFNILGDALRDLLDPKLTGGSRGRAQQISASSILYLIFNLS